MTRRIAACLALTALAAAAPPAARRILQDREPFYRGSYQAYAAPWSSYLDTSLRHGIDYRDRIAVDLARFPDGTVIDSVWPQRWPTKSGVWGYNAVSFGNYDGGRPPVPVTPRRASDIAELDQAFAFRYAGSPAFNLLTEFYLTAKPGDETAKVIEIGFFLHAPQTTVAFAHAGIALGGFRDPSGRAWSVYRQDRYVMILPAGGKDVKSGTIAIVPVLAWLRQKGILTGAEWFNGLAFGMEPAPGGGHTRLAIDRWRVTYR